jgi:hypothetical protein
MFSTKLKYHCRCMKKINLQKLPKVCFILKAIMLPNVVFQRTGLQRILLLITVFERHTIWQMYCIYVKEY